MKPVRVTGCMLALLVLAASAEAVGREPAPAGLDLVISADLDARGAGDVAITAKINLNRREALTAAVKNAGLSDPLLPFVLGSAADMRRDLAGRNFDRIRITQTLEDDIAFTKVTARIASVEPLRG